MNEITKKDYSLMNVSQADAAKNVASLFLSLQSQDKGVFTDVDNKLYLDALDGIPAWAVEEATNMYRTGRRGNGKFVPMAGELAKCALDLVEAKKEHERYEATKKRDGENLRKEILNRARLKSFHDGKTPESKARVQAMVEQVRANYALAYELAEKSTRNPNEKTDMQKTQERFAGEARAALLKTLEKQNA